MSHRKKKIKGRDISLFMKCPKKYAFEKIRENWRKQAEIYLKIFPNATKAIIVDEKGNILEEVTRTEKPS